MGFYASTGKRLVDLLLTVVISTMTAPLHALCALAILLTSGRPIYFSQARAGRDGQPFDLMKFRTMRVGTHELSGGYPDRDMITPIGGLLRRTSLDELPQLINILKGEMSLVGPRPALPDQVERYTRRQRGRLQVRPGLTGLAQLRYRNDAPWSRRIEADLEYIDNLSFRSDISLLIRTVPAVLTGSGVAVHQTAADVDDLGGQDAGD
ncbi:sugar transferase [Nocardioides sp.]|uniref:sugar transferase n=1 Tax=Nocardioides sp. TaxID=35761 RepID=UPI0035667660